MCPGGALIRSVCCRILLSVRKRSPPWGVLPKPPIGPSGRASVPASPDFFDFPDKCGLAGTLALPGQGLGNTPPGEMSVRGNQSSQNQPTNSNSGCWGIKPRSNPRAKKRRIDSRPFAP